MKFYSVIVLKVLAYAILTDAGPSMHNPFFCYTTDTIRSMTNMASMMTSYEAIRRLNFTTVNPYVSTCTPTRFWYLGRHGYILPNLTLLQNLLNFAASSIQDDIASNYAAGRTTLCKQDYESIRNWTMNEMFTEENGGNTTDDAVITLENIARRFQRVFPNILTETYTPAHFHFRHTGMQRTNKSIQAFATGLFGEGGSKNVIYEPVPEFDFILKPFTNCPAIIEEIADWERERHAFEEGPEMQELLQQVNTKLGFLTSKLNFTQIYSMWNWCQMEVSMTFGTSNSETGDDSAWCAAFSVAHFLIMEYYRDLGYFYRTGYGVRNQRLLENLNCGVMQDLLRHMQSENDADAIARIFVTDYEEVQAILVALGLFRDVWPMHRHNFAQQLQRNWLLSLIGPFGANVAVVRFDCNDGDHELIFLLNERPILIPGCDQQNGVCKLSFILNRFRRFLDANCETLFCSSD